VFAGLARWTECLFGREPGARLTYVGFRAGRPGAPIRLNIRGLGAGALKEALGLSQWLGSEPHVAELQAGCDDAVLTLDLCGERVGERRGVELMAPRSDDPESERRFLSPFLARALWTLSMRPRCSRGPATRSITPWQEKPWQPS